MAWVEYLDDHIHVDEILNKNVKVHDKQPAFEMYWRLLCWLNSSFLIFLHSPSSKPNVMTWKQQLHSRDMQSVFLSFTDSFLLYSSPRHVCAPVWFLLLLQRLPPHLQYLFKVWARGFRKGKLTFVWLLSCYAFANIGRLLIWMAESSMDRVSCIMATIWLAGTANWLKNPLLHLTEYRASLV